MATEAVSLPKPERIVTSGANALAEWEHLKAEGRGWPIIVGSDEQLEELMSLLDPRSPAPPEILLRAEALDFPKEFEAARAAMWAEVAETIKTKLAKPDEELTGLLNVDQDGEVYEMTPQEAREDLRRQLDEGPFPLGEWPGEPKPNLDMLPIRNRHGAALADVNILRIPVSNGPEVFAYLNYTAGNGPGPEYHVAALRRWHDSVGAELVALTRDSLVLRISSRPQTRDAALELAHERVLYCSDDERPLATIAHELMYTDQWFFWWD